MVRYSVLLFSVLVPVATIAPRASAQLPAGAVGIRDTDDLIKKWAPTQHLYVKGDLRIGAQQLADLESWLDQNGPHWTIALFFDVDDEQYRSLDNRTFYGLDAVEYGLGRGLALQTGFSDLTHPVTGETDGAVFVLFLKDKKFSYYGSVAQDVRSLGESNWVGNLDRPAYRAMAGGGRILDAVRDTVTSINRRLDEKIAAEAEQEQRAAQARERAVANLKSDIQSARLSILQAIEAAHALKQSYPEASGELSQPPTEAWSRQLAQVEADLTPDNVAQVEVGFHQISHEIEGYLNAYAQSQTLDANLEPIDSRMKAIQSHAIQAGKSAAEEAAKFAQQARETRMRGERGIGELVTAATDAVTRGERAIVEEEARLARAAARAKLIRTTAIITSAVLGAAGLALLYLLNRRRLPARERAHRAFADREESVKSEMDKVYGLFERSSEVLGSKEKVSKRGYEGKTKQLTDNTFEDIDDLIVMSSEVERVMSEARTMIYPKDMVGKVANMFSGSRYERGVNRISGEPLQFGRNRGLPLVIRRESEISGEELPEEISLTFDKVFTAFHDRTKTAEETLAAIEVSLLEVDDRLKLLQEMIEAASKVDRDLSEVADDDHMLAMPAFFDVLIPSAQADFDQADQVTGVDPVQAVQVHIPSGTRKITEGLLVAHAAQRARSDVFPHLNEVAPQLKELGYQTEWIPDRVDELGKQANNLMKEAATQSIHEQAEQFAADVTLLGARAAETLRLAKEVRDDAVPSLEELGNHVANARSEISHQLSLPESQCLQEVDANPDNHLRHAHELLAAAQAALQHGGTEAAIEARDALIQEIETAQELTDRSLDFLHRFEDTSYQCRSAREAVLYKVPPHEELLQQIRGLFADSALVFQAADPSFQDPSATVDSHLRTCHALLDQSERSIRDAATEKQAGRLLRSASLFDDANRNTQAADQRLTEIDQHCSRLKAVSQQNTDQLAMMERETQRLQTMVADRRTMQPTMDQFRRLVLEVDSAQREISQSLPRDPFGDAAAIAEFSRSLQKLEAQVEADLDAHTEAKRALEGARTQLRSAEDLVNRARTDGIPDSRATSVSITNIQNHESTMRSVQSRLDGQHDDWKVVDQEAARLHAALGVEAARLRGELDRAQQSADLFQSASDAVFEATRWTGGIGTRIFGSPGSSELERARQALNAGDYDVMIELARAAQIAAQHAIQRAQREVYRQQREAERQAEAARRQRRQSSIQIGGSSFPMPRSSGSSSRGGGGSSPSGSGFSRSGW